MNMSSLRALAGRATAADFAPDARFAPAGEAPPPPPEPEAAAEDPLALAFAEGFAAGAAAARAEAEAAATADAAARAGLALALSRIDAQQAEDLHRRLSETVIALCEATLAPMALDPEALERRIGRAVAMLSRADDERVIRLNPEDVKLLSPRMLADWAIVPDAALPRGALRIESTSGGVEDGPEHWRRAIAEALHAC